MFDKPITGGGRKPDDRWAVPLCRFCHDSQHASGNELAWWENIGRNPFVMAVSYYTQFGGKGGKPKRARTKTKPRRPKEQRQKISSRPFPKGRKFNER